VNKLIMGKTQRRAGNYSSAQWNLTITNAGVRILYNHAARKARNVGMYVRSLLVVSESTFIERARSAGASERSISALGTHSVNSVAAQVR
jgi:hypothetical protein